MAADAPPTVTAPDPASDAGASPATTPARYEAVCKLCGQPVSLGDDIFPLGTSSPELPGPLPAGVQQCLGSSYGKLLWAHRACWPLLPGELRATWRPPLCRTWLYRGRCPMLLEGCCALDHPAEVKRSSVQGGRLSREANIRAGSSERGKKCPRGLGHRSFVRKGHRHSAFRIFLQCAFGLKLLRSGPVLDVAGGKGLLSWELLNCAGVEEAVVVDPRPLDTRRLERKWRKGMYEPRRSGPVFCKWFPAVQAGDGLSRDPLNPLHCRVFFSGTEALHLLDSGNRGDVSPWFAREIERGRRACGAAKRLGEGDQDKAMGWSGSSVDGDTADGRSMSACTMEDCGQSSQREINSGAGALDLFGRAVLVVGMHPDQAAGEVVQFAMARGLPWAVVPCCVHGREFPHRKLPDGRHVSTYNDLVEWLQGLHPKTRTAKLDFEGRNICVYMLSGDYN